MFPTALLLDFDGVIVDSENYHVAAWQRTLLAMGRDAPDALCARAAEIDDRLFLEEIFGERISDVDVEGWLLRKEAATLQMLADAPRLYPGVCELIHRVSELKIPIGIVSTTKRENIEVVLKTARLESSIATVVAKQDVSELKPDPESYRVALKRLGLSAGGAVAIEDSETGYKSSSGAGLRTLIVGHCRASGPWHGDAVYLPNFRKIDEVLAAIGLSGQKSIETGT